VTDTVNSVAAAEGDYIAVKVAAGSGGLGNWAGGLIAGSFQGTAEHGAHYMVSSGTAEVVAASLTRYMPIVGSSIAEQTTAASREVETRAAGTFIRAEVNVTANTLSSATTVTLLVNGVASSLVISIGAGTTGTVTSTGSATVAAGDTLVWEIVTGTGTSISIFAIRVGFTAAVPASMVWSANWDIGAIGTSTVWSRYVCGGTAPASEGLCQIAHGFSGTASKMTAETDTTSTGTVTIRYRKNSADGNQLITISSGQSGIFTDESNTDTFDADDLVAYSAIRVGGSGNPDWHYIGCLETWTSG
jgi:hypothetical protein